MSYNIDNWKTKRLENLIIPISALYPTEYNFDESWLPRPIKILDVTTMFVEVSFSNQTIKGHLIEKHIHVTEIDIDGEGSGNLMNYIIEPALKQSTGHLEAVLVWEEGDSITRITVNDGDYKEEGVDL